jgi:hypothetical protein
MIDTVPDQQQFTATLKKYYNLLKPGGVCIYESFYERITAEWGNPITIDAGWVSLIELPYGKIPQDYKDLPDKAYSELSNDAIGLLGLKFEKLNYFYETEFISAGFQNVSVSLNECKGMRRYDAHRDSIIKTYYFTIRAEKGLNDASENEE